MKTRQERIDELAVKKGLATGADQRGGQDRLDPPRRTYDDGPRPDQGMPPRRKSIMGPLENPYKGG